MKSSWLCALLGGLALFSLSACSDSSDVGLGVGSDSFEGGTPQTVNIPAEQLNTTTLRPRTGRELGVGGTGTWRFLVGRVDDPVGGVIEAEGYFDVTFPASLPNRIAEADADSVNAQLRLSTNYVHGDTATTVGVEVFPLSEEAEMHQARSDTTFPAGSAATDGPVSITPTDSLVTIDLSDAWLTNNLSTLQDTSEEVHGFKLTAGNADAVVGFSSTTASLRLVHEGDSTTADYPSTQSFTHVNREGTAPSSGDHLLLQDGIGTGLEMTLDSDSLAAHQNAPLNRAEIVVPVDTSALKANDGPPTFARPLPQGFRLIATRSSEPDAPSCSSVGGLAFSEDQEACLLPTVPSLAPGAALVSNDVAFPIFDQTLRRLRNDQSPVFTQYRVHVADREDTSGDSGSTLEPGLPSTLPVLIPTDGNDPGTPRATLTVTPL